MEKIKMTNPLVEMDGDEMTRILWGIIKDELLYPFIDLKTEYYDLGLEYRNETNDEVTVLAAEAINENIWDAGHSLVLFEEVNGNAQRISIETVNGKKVRNYVDRNVSQKVEELFPNGLPKGMNVVFISLTEKN